MLNNSLDNDIKFTWNPSIKLLNQMDLPDHVLMSASLFVG